MKRLSRTSIGAMIVSLLGAILLLGVGGCTAGLKAFNETQEPRAAEARPVPITRLARSRIPMNDASLPGRVSVLSAEFTLLTITSQTDWQTLVRHLALRPAREMIDFENGMVVGVVAQVGEYAGRGWPLRITEAREDAAQTWIRADLTPGVYHPLQTAGYLELVYVPHRRPIGRVEVAGRLFIANPPSDNSTKPSAFSPSKGR